MSSSVQSHDDFSNFIAILICLFSAVFFAYTGPLWVLFRCLSWWYSLPDSRPWEIFWGADGTWVQKIQRPFDPAWRANWRTPIWAAVIGAGLVDLAAAGGIFYVFVKSRRPRKERDLRRTDSHQDLVRRGVPTGGVFAGRYGKKDFRVAYEDRGLVIGPSRTGKTVFLLNQLLKLMQDRLSFICADVKPELADIVAADLKAAGYRVVRLNPTSAATDHYNPLDDISDESGISELVINLLPIVSGQDKPFVEAKRDYLKAALLHQKAAGGASLPAAYRFLTQFNQVDKFLDVLAGSASEAAAAIGRRLQAGIKADPLVGMGFGSVGRGIEWLLFETVRECLSYSDFSLKDLGQAERPVAVFLQFEDTRLETMGACLSMLYGHIFNTLISNHRDRGPVALFFDEIGNIPPIAGLLGKLNTVGGRKLPTWTYWQTAAQMNQRYGRDADQTFFASADLQMFFRTQDEGTQRMIAALAGTTNERQRAVSTDGRSRSVTTSERRVNVIEPHELGELAKGDVVCLYRGGKAIGQAQPHYLDYKQYSQK